METAENQPPGDAGGFKAAAASYLAARLELIRIEAAEATHIAVRRGILAGLLAAFAVFAWALILAGLVGWIADRLAAAGHEIPWHLVAIGFGIIHLLLAAIVGTILSRRGPPTFVTTRIELEKDREWLANLSNQIGSKH